MGNPFSQLSMLLRPCVEQADRSLRCFAVVLICLLELSPAASTVYVLPGLAIDETHIVESEPDYWSVSFEQIFRIVWELALQTSNYKRQVRDSIEEWSREFVEGVRNQPVDHCISNIECALVSMSDCRSEEFNDLGSHVLTTPSAQAAS